MRRIGETEVREGVAEEEVTEVVGNGWDRHRVVVEQQQAEDYGKRGEKQACPERSFGKLAQGAFGGQPQQNRRREQHREAEQQKIAEAEAGGILKGQQVPQQTEEIHRNPHYFRPDFAVICSRARRCFCRFETLCV